MSSEEPLKPGQIRISRTRKISLPTDALPPYHRVHGHQQVEYSSFSIALRLLVIGAFIFAIVISSWKEPPQEPRDSSLLSIVGRVTLPPKPVMEGRYAAFLLRGPSQSLDVLVFTYENIQINVVSFLPDEVLGAIPYPSLTADQESSSSSTRNSEAHPHGPLGDPISFAHTPRVAPRPYVIRGDVTVECGPLFNRDELITRLMTRHGDLKQAQITIIDGAPRGPPRKSDFVNRPARTVYIVGRITKFSGPLQKDKSYLDASIIDLGPNSAQLDQYIAETSKWRANVATLVGHYPVSDDLLWRAEAEKGLEITRDPLTRGYTRPLGQEIDPSGNYIDRPVDHPVDHPVL